MIELRYDKLTFSFPEVHPEAKMWIEFQRTLRIPDDDGVYPLPPGLGAFPLRHVDDYADRVPATWMTHGGVMLPMYQAEAMWLNFGSHYLSEHGVSYPFALKIATGKINAVNGRPWQDNGLRAKDDHVVVPGQPWLDGFCVEKGIIRQFVAMPLGAGYTVEEQITGSAEHGGLQIAAYPMKREAFERRFPKIKRKVKESRDDSMMTYSAPSPLEMGLAAGGRMRQEIKEDPYPLHEWNQESMSRCFVHIANSMVWRAITGQAPPTVPPTAKEYTRAGLPWFDYYGEGKALDGAEALEAIKSVRQLGDEKGDVPLPENESVKPGVVVQLHKKLKEGQVREGRF